MKLFDPPNERGNQVTLTEGTVLSLLPAVCKPFKAHTEKINE